MDSPKKRVPWNKGKPAWNKGKPASEEQKQRLREMRLGTKLSEEHKRKISDGNKGRQFSEETRAKIGAKHRGKQVSEEARAKIGAAGKGRKPPITGKKHTLESRAKMRKSNLKHWESMTDEQRAAKTEELLRSTENITQSWIEDVIAQRLDTQGITYERQKRIGWYRVDFYIPAQNKVIEVQGCYWHQCTSCGYEDTWAEKKRIADAKRHGYLLRKGYILEVIWEHELPRKPRLRGS